MDSPLKTLELDKICRVCLSIKKDMRPLFGEITIAEMLMDFTRIRVENTDGWPDKICLQCVQQVSRCHAFKIRVEKTDQQLREYIKGITVIVEESVPQIEHPIVTARPELKATRIEQIPHQIQIQPHHHATEILQPQILLANGQVHNVINAGHLVTATPTQTILQATPQTVSTGQNIQLCQLVQTSNGNIQMIQNPPQLVQIQRTADDRCEIIVQPPESGETQYYTEDEFNDLVEASAQHAIEEDEIDIDQDDPLAEEISEVIDETMNEDEEEVDPDEDTVSIEISDDSDYEDREYVAEFINLQTSISDTGLHVCNLCRKEFEMHKFLQIHMKSHSNWIKANCKKQPQCHLCHRSFKGPGMLKMHMKTHEKKHTKPPSCRICNKTFKTKAVLYRHRQIHSEKFIQCDVCQKLFATYNQLCAHQKKYNHGQLCKCSICNITFKAHSEFKLHIVQHRLKTDLTPA